jgi:hypothetical protein
MIKSRGKVGVDPTGGGRSFAKGKEQKKMGIEGRNQIG